MDTIRTAEYARALYAAHGDKAEAEAAQKEQHSKALGNRDEAQSWQAVRRAIRQMRGANQS
ncbi:hypothetical protein KQ247_16005 [Ruegeria pomeroyi]|nr:hypothetical protein [Ruegeria pomeroyi]MCE8546763.1 hypothetical protein [Ruegeria pomeroyi]NVK95855.1 hypothetical protein [Ruegeria pomeroyi]NVL00166.1 hypothetical protein [Ruegeria pomeroyi]QWV08307.1 hypothetical protein KQ247_16005 [Ruegeria pomeroyi]